MARAKRHYLPGHIWHITHRYHKREFLLRFSKDRHRWLQWLYQARKRYGLKILDYMVTSNHIHLLVADDGGRGVIPKSMQLVAGRTGQELMFPQKIIRWLSKNFDLQSLVVFQGRRHTSGMLRS